MLNDLLFDPGPATDGLGHQEDVSEPQAVEWCADVALIGPDGVEQVDRSQSSRFPNLPVGVATADPVYLLITQ